VPTIASISGRHLRFVLHRAGVIDHARDATNGEQALEIARDFLPEVAFLDLHMPGLSGTELARVLRAEPWASRLRIIALTGMGQASDVEASRAAGFEARI